MQTLTLAVYWLVAVFGVVVGSVAVVAPSAVLRDLTPLGAHLVREEGACFVFIGLVAAWRVLPGGPESPSFAGRAACAAQRR